MLQTHKTGFKFWGRQESAEVMPKAQACNKFSLSLSLACTPIKETYFEKEIHHVNVHDWCNIYSYYLSHTVIIHIVDSHRRHTSVLAGWIHRNPYLWFQWILILIHILFFQFCKFFLQIHTLLARASSVAVGHCSGGWLAMTLMATISVVIFFFFLCCLLFLC